MSPNTNNCSDIRSQFVQEYFSAVASAERLHARERGRTLMHAQAELLFHLNGEGKCAKCPAHVRHVIRVTTVHEDGGGFDFDALCIRCQVAEETIASQVTFSLKPEHLNQLVEVLENYRPARAVAA